MRTTTRRAAIASILGAAGMAAAQGQWAATSRDGDPLVREWRLGAGERVRIGTGDGAGSAADLTPVFVPAGVNPEADSHSAAAYLPDGSAVVVANRVSKNLTVFNPNTRALIRNIPLSGSPQGLAISPDGTRAVTANMFEGTASVVNLATGAELSVVPVGTNPVVARITPDGLTAVVSCNGPQTLYVIDIASASVVRTIASGGYQTQFSVNFEAQGIGFRSTGPVLISNTTALYPTYNNNSVKIIDITTGATTTVPTSPNPTTVVVAAGKAYVSHTFPGRQVTEIDLASATVTRTFTAFASDTQGPLAVNPAGTRLVVAIQNACQVVDLPTGAISGSLNTASVNELLTTSDGNYALGVGFFGSVISFASQSVVGNPNQFVSCSTGAVSPVSSQAAMFSDTFGEDMVVINAGGSPALVNAGPTGPAPEGDKTRVVGLTPSGAKAVAINQFSNTATVVDTASGAQLAIANAGRRTGGVAISPDGSRAVVTNRDGTTATVLNLNTYTVADVPISTRGDQVRISPDGHYAYVAVVSGGDGVWRIDLTSNTVAGPKLLTGDMGSYFQGYSSFSGIALSHNGATLVTCNSFAPAGLSVIDTASWSVVATVPFPVGSFPARAVFSPDDSRLYVSNLQSATVSVVNVPPGGAGSAIVGTIPVGTSPTELTLNPSGSRLWVMNTGNSNVGVIDTAAMAQVSTISFATNPDIDGVVVSPDGSKLYISHSGGTYTIGNGGYSTAQSTVLSVLDASSGTVLDTMNGPNLAAGIAIAPSGTVLGFPNLMSEGLTLVSLGTACYANCDASTTPPVANVADFTCFLQKFAANDPYANCDASTTPPVINVADFTCFLQKFAAGCP